MVENYKIVTKKDLLKKINNIQLKNLNGRLAIIKTEIAAEIENEVEINDENDPRSLGLN